ncbi:MAG: UPF0182 family protein, partial [Oculatellaceae cyanobacterium bins.114]|nr:UPF0182 family protein [Oculatellaceae cyanobacterium bins.114]
VLGLSGLISLLVLYYGHIAASYWLSGEGLAFVPEGVPAWFYPDAVWQMMQNLPTLWAGQWGWLGLLSGLAIALLIYPRWLLSVIALIASLCFALTVANHWTTILAAMYATPFEQSDPVFQHDIGFFVFSLPIWQLVGFWLIGLLMLAFCSIGLLYLLAANSLSQGEFLGFSEAQQRHLLTVGGCLMLAIALGHWLDRYNLLYSDQGSVYGASYTNILADLPGRIGLTGVAFVLGAIALWSGLLSRKPRFKPLTPRGVYTIPARVGKMRPRLGQSWLYSLGAYLGMWAIATWILPLAIQRLVVQPNELSLERPYILRTLTATRQAFNLETIDVATFNPQYGLNQAALQRNRLTINNIRLWDTRPLLESNRQLQRIRPYYEFPDADIDRYTLPADGGNTTQQQMFIAARELDYSSVPQEAQTWVNQHLIYTHGYGFTLSPVNTAGEGGLPDYFIQGIEQTITDERIRAVVPVDNPQIYYGEITDNYVMTGTGVQELDYPSGSDNVYNTYDGHGGIRLGNGWRRLLYAKHLGDWRILLADSFTPQTRLLFRRQIIDRVKTIAPFLRYDADPYLVVVKVDEAEKLVSRRQDEAFHPSSATPHHLYWVLDAYTTSDRYPYSDPGDNPFNYIRNSVKVVVDAYHGSVNFYVTDWSDPIIQTWNHAFPKVFQALDQMPAALRRHIRYPEDLYRVQSNQLMVYHMTDPQVFYNREDQWRAPNEIYGDEQQLVEPYYLIMKLPTGSSEEFILFRPYAPEQRTNLVAWLAARSDGDNYGKMLLYRFPKQELVYGPEQLEARINQDPVISQQISLWNRRGSRALQGNLLVIPIERSLLYVEPLYLEAEQNRLPILARVIVAYGDRIAMAETLEQSLNAVFEPNTPETPAIIRPLEEESVP